MTTYEIWDDRTNEHIADIYYKDNNYTAKLNKFTGYLPVLFGFPIAGTNTNPTSDAIENFLKDRVIPSNRDMLKEILHQNNIYEYDWKELIKLNKGKTTDDFFRIEVIESDN